MRKSIAGYVTLTITICILVYVSFSSNETIDLSKYSTAGLELNYTVSQDESIDNNVLASNELKKADIPYLGKSFVGFKEALAFKESRWNYFVVNTLGYLGKYQFGRGTLKLIGINKGEVLLTQGFIGRSDEGFVTTLGREGSDYTAAILAYVFEADNVVIWKDVPGMLNADPRIFSNAVKLDEISFKEAIELSYYGATVIHPKTLQPLKETTCTEKSNNN